MRAVLAATSIAALTLTSLVLGTTAASAAPGDPFDPYDPVIFIAQDLNPTRLYIAEQGSTTPILQGGTGGVAYNAIGYNAVDGYLYGIRKETASQNNNSLTNHLVRIGQGGAVTVLGAVTSLPTGGNDYNQGTFGTGADAETLFVRRSTNEAALWRIDVSGDPTPANPATAVKVDLTASVPNLSDIVYLDGYLWGFHSNGRAYRIDPVTGAVDSYVHGLGNGWNGSTWTFGAQWVFGNGNIGLSRNSNGNIYQVRIDGSTTATPTFTLVSVSTGPASTNNDGAAIPGWDVDLGIEKTGPATYVPDGSVTYTLTVTNHGPGLSSGFAVHDTLPAAITSPSTTTPECTIVGQELDCSFGTLAKDDTRTITVIGTVAAGTTGAIENTATVIGNENDPDPENDSDGHTIDPLLSSSLSLVKTATPTDPDDFVLGGVITYSFSVTNTGQTTITGLEIDELDFSGEGDMSAVVCPVSMLDPTDTTTCTATYTLEQEDVDAGEVVNTARATGVGPGSVGTVSSNESDARVPGTQGPELTLQKSASPTQASAAGTSVTYTFVVRNTGNVTLTGVGVDEIDFTGTGALSPVDCPETELDPLESMTCQATYTVTQEDIDEGGTIDNVAEAVGTPSEGDEISSEQDDATVAVQQSPAITIVKSALQAEVTAEGDVVDYTFLVQNTGNVTLTDVSVTEGAFNGAGALTTIVCPATTLAPTATTTCTATYTVQTADLALAQLTNTATVTGIPPSGSEIASPPSTKNVPVNVPNSAILSLVKGYVWTDVNGNGLTDPGDQIVWTFAVANTGVVPVTGIVIEDELIAGLGLDIVCAADSLTAPPGPGSETTCESQPHTITPADAAEGEIYNIATAAGEAPEGVDDPVSLPDDATVPVVPTPVASLSLVKDAEVADVNGNSVTDPGDTVVWTFTVTNTGTVPLEGLAIDDPLLADLEVEVTCPAEPLTVAPDAGSSTTCSSEPYVITAADAAAGEIRNIATAAGTVPEGTPGAPEDPTSEPDEATIPVVPTPVAALSLAKDAQVTDVNGNGVTDPGDTVVWTFTVTNTGTVPLEGLAIDDPLLADLSLAVTCAADTLPAPPGAGSTTTCESGVYTITEADAAAGGVHNVATATGEVPEGTPGDPEDPTSPPSEVTVPVVPTPVASLTLEKGFEWTDVNGNGLTDPGDEIVWTFLVENTGTVPLDGVIVEDGLLDDLGIVIVCSPSSLAATESVACRSGIHTLTEADAAAGGIRNVAIATGTVPDGTPGDPADPTSPESEVTVPVVPIPVAGLSLEKGFILTIDQGGDGQIDEGDTIVWTFLVENTGTLPLEDIVITDPMLADLGLEIDCDARRLPAGISTTCRSEPYTVTVEDALAGSIRNVATASGEVPPGTAGDPGNPPPAEAGVTVPVGPPVPAMTLVKSAALRDANGNGRADAGERVDYSFILRNTGNVLLSDVRVDDPMLMRAGIAVVCPATVLAPGAEMACTAQRAYVVTDADVRAGSVHNVATGHGIPPEGVDPLMPPTAEVTVLTGARPGPGLPVTGEALVTGTMALGALLLLGGGVLLLRRGRREQEA